MKQKGIAAVIDKRFKKIDSHFHSVITGFEIEPIHEFRTDIKKLRAFFRLLNVEIDEDRLKVSKRMKMLYGYGGTIRNFQLQLKNMHAYLADPRYTIIEAYMEYLKKMIEKWKANAIEFNGQGSNFRDDNKKIHEQLPERLRRASVKKFLQNKMSELAYLLKELPGDDVLHQIRKILKDILYNWVFIKRYKKLLPPDFSTEEKIKPFTEILGLFMDKSIGVILLETYCKDCEENGLFIEKEMSELQEIERNWKREKQELMHIIYLNPGLQQFSSVN